MNGKESRGLEAQCRGGQGPPRAVAPSGGGGRAQKTPFQRQRQEDGIENSFTDVGRDTVH